MPVTYAYPNGTLFSVEKAWLTAAGIMDVADPWSKFGRTTYRLLPPAAVSASQEIRNVPLGRFTQPMRPEQYRLLDGDRLTSVLNAMRGDTALPPVTMDETYTVSMDRSSGRGYRVVNGFHRFHACIVYGYSEIPTLAPKAVSRKPTTTKSSVGAYVPPHLRGK